MSKRPLAALCALLALMAVLVAVPLATTETAEAHTKTVKRCSYDPFAGSQCWYEKVAHTHRTIPDNPPPDTSPKPKKCPTGTTGTPPNCLPDPPDNTNHVPVTTTTAPPPQCADGYSGTPPNCVKDTTEDEGSGSDSDGSPKTCPAGQHSNGGAGKNCHANHDYSNIPCGTGTWSPGHGHSSVSRPACKNDNGGDSTDDDGDSGSGSGTGGTTTTTTSTDPCKTWASNTRNALQTANPDGTYNISPAPSGCGITTQELMGKVRVAGANFTREMEQIFKDWTEATEGVARLNAEERRKAWTEYQKSWDALPEPVRDAAIAAACSAIIPATKGKALRNGALAAACSAALGVDLTIPDLPDDDSGGGSGSYGGGTDDESDDDSGSGHPGGTDDDSGSGSGGSGGNDPDDLDGDGDFDDDDVVEARRRMARGELDPDEYIRLHGRNWCSKPGHCE